MCYVFIQWAMVRQNEVRYVLFVDEIYIGSEMHISVFFENIFWTLVYITQWEAVSEAAVMRKGMASPSLFGQHSQIAGTAWCLYRQGYSDKFWVLSWVGNCSMVAGKPSLYSKNPRNRANPQPSSLPSKVEGEGPTTRREWGMHFTCIS